MSSLEELDWTPDPYVEGPYVPNVSLLIDEHLETVWQKESAAHKSSGRTWTASGLGGCLRAQYLSRHLKVPGARRLDSKSRKRFEVGKMWHAKFAEWFEGAGVLQHAELDLSDPELDIAAFVDFIIGKDDWTTGIELKSVHSDTFWYRKQYKGGVAKFENMMQSAMYSILAERKGLKVDCWLVVNVSKDDLTIEQDLVGAGHKEEALRRLSVLKEAVKTGDPPPCSCIGQDERGEGGWGWKYCDHYHGSEKSRTEQTEVPSGEFYKVGPKKGQPKMKKVFLPDGPCCPVDVLDFI